MLDLGFLTFLFNQCSAKAGKYVELIVLQKEVYLSIAKELFIQFSTRRSFRKDK